MSGSGRRGRPDAAAGGEREDREAGTPPQSGSLAAARSQNRPAQARMEPRPPRLAIADGNGRAAVRNSSTDPLGRRGAHLSPAVPAVPCCTRTGHNPRPCLAVGSGANGHPCPALPPDRPKSEAAQRATPRQSSRLDPPNTAKNLTHQNRRLQIQINQNPIRFTHTKAGVHPWLPMPPQPVESRANRLRLPRKPRLDPGSGAGVTDGGMQYKANGNRCDSRSPRAGGEIHGAVHKNFPSPRLRGEAG